VVKDPAFSLFWMSWIKAGCRIGTALQDMLLVVKVGPDNDY
jgi:hypothetical protein